MKTPQPPEPEPNKDDFHHGFMAEFDFFVRGDLLQSARLIFNESFANEQSFAMELTRQITMQDLLGESRSVSAPSWLQFLDDGRIQFSMLYLDNSVETIFTGRHQTAFMTQLFLLSKLGVRFDLLDCRNIEFAARLNVVMVDLSKLQSSDEIDIADYYGLLF